MHSLKEPVLRRGVRACDPALHGCLVRAVAHEEQDAVRLWEAAGYHRDEQIARFVRNL
jgi:hypothetical protein